jgi:hypothetical protein
MKHNRDRLVLTLIGFVGGALLAAVAGRMAAVVSGVAGALAMSLVSRVLLPYYGPINWKFFTGFLIFSCLSLISHLIFRAHWPGAHGWLTVITTWLLACVFVVYLRLCRWRRIRRGLCPACAYPVGQSPSCTECGYTLKSVRT